MSERDLRFPDPPKRPETPWGNGPDRNDRWPGLTAEALASYREDLAAWGRAVEMWRVACDEIAGAAARLLIAHGFPADVRAWTERGNRGRNAGRRGVLALNAALRDFGPSCLTERPSLYSEEEWLRRAGFRDREEEEKREAAALRDRAVAWLLARGQVYGRDFMADDAATKALHMAASAIIERQTGRWNEFTGQNCEGPCRGWNGTDRRCECGNRRVSWTIEGTFEAPVVYGEAY